LAVRGARSVEQPASNYFIGARRRQRRIVESPFGKDRREARRDQEHVALADRHVELLRKKKHHVAARLRTAGFQKTQMPRRNSGVTCEIKLAQTPPLAPLAQKAADRRGRIEHDPTLAPSHAVFKLPPR